MKTFKIVPQIVEYESSSDFCNEFKIGSGDLVFLSKSSEKYFAGKLGKAHVIYRGDYGSGEPTDVMVEKIYEDIKNIDYKFFFFAENYYTQNKNIFLHQKQYKYFVILNHPNE